MLTILGLGPGDPKLLTREAWDTLQGAAIVWLRTRRHPTVAGLPTHLTLRDFDALYDSASDFAEVYAAIAQAIITEAGAQPDAEVIYAVPGHPLVGESTVPMLLERARSARIPVRIVSGLSFIEPVLERLQSSGVDAPQHLDPFEGLQLCDALDLAGAHHPPLNPDKPALIAQTYSRAVAADVKLTLMNQYPPEHQVHIVGEGGTRMFKLHEMDHGEYFDHLTSLYVPGLPTVSSFEGLQETMAYLRAPEGCPWDQVQTHESLRNTLLEETYEVLTAIDEGDMQGLKEELGDLLFNVIFQAQMATEAEEFRMSDVIAEVDAKLKRRHPHVFGDQAVSGVGQVLTNWDVIKRQEHKDKGQERTSALDGIAPALPALAQAQKMAHRAERAGFKWEDNAQRLAKVREELEEVVNARDDAHRQEELGDLFFTLADYADGYGIDAETAAREANLKFARRYRGLERLVKSRGQDMKTMTADQLLDAWRDIKAREPAHAGDRGRS